MKQDKLIKCNKCSKSFILSSVKIHEKYLGAMLTEVFFYCPKCKKRYLICVKNNKINQLINKIEYFRELKDLNKVSELKKELKSELKKYNGK